MTKKAQHTDIRLDSKDAAFVLSGTELKCEVYLPNGDAADLRAMPHNALIVLAIMRKIRDYDWTSALVAECLAEMGKH